MQSPIAHICRDRSRTDAQRAAIARIRTHVHVPSTNMPCPVHMPCIRAILLRTLLRTSLRRRVFRGDDAHSSQPARHRAPRRSALPLCSSPLLPGASRHRVCKLAYAARRHAAHCCTPALRLILAHRCDAASPRHTARHRSDPATRFARARNHAQLAPSPAPPLASALCSPPLARYRTARVPPRVAVR